MQAFSIGTEDEHDVDERKKSSYERHDRDDLEYQISLNVEFSKGQSLTVIGYDFRIHRHLADRLRTGCKEVALNGKKYLYVASNTGCVYNLSIPKSENAQNVSPNTK